MIDESAIAAVYERYGHALYHRCLRLVSNEDDARELMQECFFQFWKSRERFQERASPFTYLYRIATNLSIDRLRRRKTRGVQVEVDQANTKGSQDHSPERRIGAASELAVLTEGLDPGAVTVAVMAHVDGLTQEEIATALGLSRRTVGKRLKKFMNHTRKRAKRADTGSQPESALTGAHGG